ncbi:hypothetical protein M3Y98_00349700 [Aphelenchoides besseyi]|nr:hypothetical protein M3Y98_00349700 [Aphelenchoides besseyi]
MVGTVNRPITRSQSRANANRLNTQNPTQTVSEAAAKLDTLPERAAKAAEDLLADNHTKRINFLLSSVRGARNDAWRYAAIEEIFRDSKAPSST